MSNAKQDTEIDESDDKMERGIEAEVAKIHLSDAAPEVDLNILVVENNGLQVTNRPKMGRVTIATRDFTQLHVPVLREMPAIICRVNDYMDYLEKFLNLPVQIQVGVLDMFFQPLSSPIGQTLVEPAKLLYLLGVLDDFNVIHQLLSIYVTNAHQYQGDQSALPIMGSKLPHSCNPNVGYSSLAEDGCVEYKVIRPIKKGEMISFSYLSDLFETPTFERRKLLFSTKSFFCQCARCCGPDFCRYIRCPSCQEQLVACQYLLSHPIDKVVGATPTFVHATPYWRCPTCTNDHSASQDGNDQAMLRIERELDSTIRLVERTILTKTAFKRNGDTNTTPALLQELIQECSSRLSPVHYLTIKTLRLMVNLCTSLAYIKIKQQIVRYGCRPTTSNDMNSISSLFRKSVDAGFQLIAACECVAVGCSGCKPLLKLQSYNGFGAACNVDLDVATIFPHDPLYDRATPMRHVCDNLMQLPVHWWPCYAGEMTERYMDVLKAKYDDVEDVGRTVVERWEKSMCFECETSIPDK